jgi:hypothetical protein
MATETLVDVTNDYGGCLDKGGAKITMTSNANIISITKKSSCDATTGYILDSSKGVLASASFSGDTATFASPYAVTDTTTYYIVAGVASGSYQAVYQGSVSYPISKTICNIIAGMKADDGADGSTWAYNVISFDYTLGGSSGGSNKLVCCMNTGMGSN